MFDYSDKLLRLAAKFCSVLGAELATSDVMYIHDNKLHADSTILSKMQHFKITQHRI